MRALLEEIRRNPDIVAVLALCLMLGLGKTTTAPGPALRIHQVLERPAQCVVQTVTSHIPQFYF